MRLRTQSGARLPISRTSTRALRRIRYAQQARRDNARIITFANGSVVKETLVTMDRERRRLVYL